MLPVATNVHGCRSGVVLSVTAQPEGKGLWLEDSHDQAESQNRATPAAYQACSAIPRTLAVLGRLSSELAFAPAGGICPTHLRCGVGKESIESISMQLSKEATNPGSNGLTFGMWRRDQVAWPTTRLATQPYLNHEARFILGYLRENETDVV